MGYDLDVLVHTPTNVTKLYELCRDAIGIRSEAETVREEKSHYSDGRRIIRSIPCGAPSSLHIEYGVDGPLQGCEYDFGEDWAEQREHNGWTSVSISLGSGFGGVAHLHYIVEQLGQQLDRKGLVWCWIDPQTGGEYESVPSRVSVELAEVVDAGREKYKIHEYFS